MIGTSGSDARLIVDKGDLRLLVDEVERLTVEPEGARGVGSEYNVLPEMDGRPVDDWLLDR